MDNLFVRNRVVFLKETAARFDNVQIQSKILPRSSIVTSNTPKPIAKKATAKKAPQPNIIPSSSTTPTHFYASSLPSKHVPYSDLTTLQIGNEVNHAHFGKGKVVQLMTSTEMRKAVILFHNFGEKTLLLSYARLENIAHATRIEIIFQNIHI